MTLVFTVLSVFVFAGFGFFGVFCPNVFSLLLSLEMLFLFAGLILGMSMSSVLSPGYFMALLVFSVSSACVGLSLMIASARDCGISFLNIYFA